MKRMLAAIILTALTGAITLGFSRIDPTGFADAKRQLRLGLGLPKQWVRGVNSDVAGYQKSACPSDATVIVTGGQSNAANAFSEPLPADPRAAAFMMQDGACYALRDPVLGASGQEGSLWTGLGAAMWRQTGRPVVFINGAVGGTQLGDWLDDRSGYLKRLLGQVAQARRAGLSADYVFWIQGETDAAVFLPPADYVEEMQALLARVDASGAVPAGVPWVVYRSTKCMARPGNGPAIDQAVTAWAARSPRIILGPWASRLGDAERRDGCHFNGRGRQRLIDETLAILRSRLTGDRGSAPRL